MISKPTCQIIDDIISKFDFELVRAYMTVNKWYWWGENRPPTIDELIRKATSLLIEVIVESKNNGDSLFCSTGGFKASYNKHNRQYSLEFIIQKKYTGAN